MIAQLKTKIRKNSAIKSLTYIDNPEKNIFNGIKYSGCINCDFENIKEFNRDIQLSREIYQSHKRERDNAPFANHYIVSFPPEFGEKNHDITFLKNYAKELGEEAFKGFNTYYSIHFDKDHIHIHYITSCYSNEKEDVKYKDNLEKRVQVFKLSEEKATRYFKLETLKEYKKEKRKNGEKINYGNRNHKNYKEDEKKEYEIAFEKIKEVYTNSTSISDFISKCKEKDIQVEQRIRRGKISSFVFLIDNNKYTSSKFEEDIFQPDKLFKHYAEIKKQNEEKYKQDRIIQQKQFEINSQQKRIDYLKEMNSKPINTYINYNNGLPEPINDMLKVIKFFKELKRRIENKKIIEELEIKIKSYEETIKYFSENKSVENYLSLKNYYKLDSRISEIERKNENYQFLKNDLKHLKVVRDSIDDKEYIKNKLEELKKSEQYINLNTENIKDEDKYIEDLSSQLNNYKPKSYLKQKNKSSVRDDLRE